MRTSIPLLLDRARTDTLTEQLIDQLREAIRRGRVAPGERLPSSRQLADQLAIARNTAMRAYESLVIEGYAESRPASGIFAATALPATPAAAIEAQPSPSERVVGRAPLPKPVSIDGSGMLGPRGGISFDFSPFAPSAAEFPIKIWRRLLQKSLSRGGAAGLSQVGDLAGLATLRVALARHLAGARGVGADPGQILVLSGVREGVALAARILLGPGRMVVAETPTYRSALAAFTLSEAKIRPVGVDDDGIVVESLPEIPATLLYVTPSHQYPTGQTLSLERRHTIVAWARRNGCYILEDDSGGDYRFEGAPLPAIASLAPDCTIHLGSFAKSLGASLRLGYLVAPPELVDTFRAAKSVLSGGQPWLEQSALAEMIDSGSYSAHLARLRVHYRESRDCLLLALQRFFGEVAITGANAGQHVLWHLPAGVPDAATMEAWARRARVGVYSLGAANAAETPPSRLTRRGLVLGYGALSQRQIEQGIARLADAVDDMLDRHHEIVAELLNPPPPLQRPAQPVVRFRRRPALRPAAQPRAFSPKRDAMREDNVPKPVVFGLYRYPIKGLSAQAMPGALFETDKPLAFDRQFALARPGGPIDPAAPKWARKGVFVMLMLDEALARVQTFLDTETLDFFIRDGDATVLKGNLGDPQFVAEAEAYFQQLVPSLDAPPHLVRMPEGHFMDKPDNVISMINLATVRSLEERWGYAINPMRFRANIYVDGAKPWEEFDWIGAELAIGDATFRVDRRNGRCSATNVNPDNGVRDLDLPGSLRTAFGHKDLGVYLVVKSGGKVVVGDSVTVPDHLAATPGPAAPEPLLGVAGRRRYICRGCYYIYDEAKGAPQIGVAPGTDFAALAADYRCPDCGTDKDKLRPYVEITPSLRAV